MTDPLWLVLQTVLLKQIVVLRQYLPRYSRTKSAHPQMRYSNWVMGLRLEVLDLVLKERVSQANVFFKPVSLLGVL
jgi:hypothetical protein